jgi:hypothetical protein
MSWAVFTQADAGSAWVQRQLQFDSVSISDSVNERSTANATLVSADGSLLIDEGMGVRIERSGDVVFRGFVDDVTETRIGIGGARAYKLQCVDVHYLADKRLVVAAYQTTTAGAIVRDLISTILGGEGITAGEIAAGPTIRNVTFNYIPVSDAIRDLAVRAGFWWRVNPDKSLDFTYPLETRFIQAGDTTILAGDESYFAGAVFVMSDPEEVDLGAAALADSLVLAKRAPSYRNRQWIRGGRDKTDPQVEIQFGDGEKRAFLVGFPVAVEPTVEVSFGGGAWTPQTVGVAGIQSGRQWSWSFNSSTLTHDSGETVLGATDRVRVSYTGFFDVVAVVNDAPAQTIRAALEGGTGVVEKVLLDKGSTSRDAAFQLAGELLDYFTPASLTVRFATQDPGFAAGQVLRVIVPGAAESPLDGLVTTVEHFSRQGVPHSVVTVVSGPQEGSWAQWLGALSRRLDRATDVGGGQVDVVTTLEIFSKLWTEGESPNIFRQTRVGTALVGSSYPEFLPEDRVKFVSWFYGGDELGRKAFTLQEGADTDEIETTTVLITSDAVGPTDELVWWGGWQATSALGTGVEVDRRAFVKVKTDIEQLQILRTDTRWA